LSLVSLSLLFPLALFLFCSVRPRYLHSFPTRRSSDLVLLMDEPFASVDAQTRMDLEDLVLTIRRQFGITIVFVTHDIEESIYLRSEEHTSELQSRFDLVCRLLLEKKKNKHRTQLK